MKSKTYITEKFAFEESERMAAQTGWDSSPYQSADRREGWSACVRRGEFSIHYSRQDGTYFVCGPTQWIPQESDAWGAPVEHFGSAADAKAGLLRSIDKVRQRAVDLAELVG